MIQGDIRIEINVYTDQKYQEKVEAYANMLLFLKQRDQINKGHDDMDIPAEEEVSNVSINPLL